MGLSADPDLRFSGVNPGCITHYLRGVGGEVT